MCCGMCCGICCGICPVDALLDELPCCGMNVGGAVADEAVTDEELDMLIGTFTFTCTRCGQDVLLWPCSRQIEQR